MSIQIRGGQIKSASISGTQLATGAIDNSNLFASSVVTSSALAANSVTGAAIADGAIGDADMFANSVITAAKINLNGLFDFSNGGTLRASSPTNSSDVATKSYVDGVSEGVRWKQSVRVATTANIDISSAPSAIDGITLAENDRILVKNQSTASQNGIYDFASAGSALTRSSDANAAGELSGGAAVFVQAGATNQDQGYVQTATLADLNANQVWTQFTGLSQVTAGNGLAKSGNEIAVDLSASSGLEFSSGELQVKLGNGVMLDGSTKALMAKINGSTLALDSNGLKVGTITSSELGSNSVTGAAIADGAIGDSGMFAAGVVDSSALAANSIVTAKIGSAQVTLAKLASNSVDETKIAASVAGSGLSGGGGSALAVSVDDASIQITGDSINVKALGIAASMLQSNAVESAKIASNAVVASKIGARFYQEAFQIANGTTSTLDLARALDSNFFSSAEVFINGLAALNCTATGSGSASNNTEYEIANNGAGSVGRISFGANLVQNDAVVIKYFT